MTDNNGLIGLFSEDGKEQLQARNEKLSAMVEELTAAKDRLRREVASLVELRSASDKENLSRRECLASLIHDLRQPFQSLGLLQETLENGISEQHISTFSDRFGQALFQATEILNHLSAVNNLGQQGSRCACETSGATRAQSRKRARRTPPDSAAAAAQPGPIFVVDDSPQVLQATRDLLEHNGYAVETFMNGAAFFDACRPDQGACVLVDALMPGMNGFDLIERLRAEQYVAPAIMITGAGDVPMAVRAMKAGAADFIEKPVGASELLSCIQNALGRTRDAASETSRRAAALARLAVLTERQRQILTLILNGDANKNIAAKLGLSQRTVESHRAAIMKKTGARSFAALIRWAMAAA